VAAGTCDNANCTVATTGKCLLSHPDPLECPHFLSGEALAPEVPNIMPTSEEARLLVGETKVGRKFHLGNELGTEDASEIMRARYSHLIGVLGSTDAGKTCFLSSLYLMASGGSLPESHQFAGSLTLQAFEDRARGLREWTDGRLPVQLADHTFLADPRQPSLLHLAIRERNQERRRFDLLLTDLPGEWTDNLVRHASDAESFRFLQRADGIILVVDGIVLLSAERHVELQRMRNFTERLANEVNVTRDTPFVIAVSKSDEIGMQMPAAANQLADYVRSFGYPTTTISVASFSRKPDEIKSGTGVFSAMDTILAHPQVSSPGGLAMQDREPGVRTFHNFRT
jgi:hypothetical protein